MKTRYSLNVILLHLILMANSAYTSQTISEEVLGLIAFKSELLDPLSHLSSWSVDDQSPCSWRFVRCNPNTGRVSELSLHGLDLSGKLSKGIQKLDALEVFDVSNNNFGGSIDDHFGEASRLQLLNLRGNTFSSPIPSTLFKLKRLRFLDISFNHFTGVLPDDAFKNCSNLRYLSLAGNSFRGNFPGSIGECSSLNTLDVSSNYFSGDLDFASGFWLLKRLRKLNISHNFFQGTIPSGIHHLQFLKALVLRNNWFSGPIPEDIGLCIHLRELDMSENQFNGNVPDSLSQLKELITLSISNSRVSGDFPSWVFSIPHLQHLDLSNNVLTGNAPVGQLESLQFFDSSYNRIGGGIPATLANCSALKVIRMRSNFLSGIIPAGFFNLSLEDLDLSDNSLTGIIPSFSSSFSSSIRSIDLSLNNLGGHLAPDWVPISSSLRYLNVSWNRFDSKLPEEVGYLQNLNVLDLRSNNFYGGIPSDLCESSNLSILLLDSNSLTGPIPTEIGNCSLLSALGLSHNDLTGGIPQSISKMSKLKILKLEFNHLEGKIPNELGSLKNLRDVNVSYNKLFGMLPDNGIFPKLDASSLRGNLGLCSQLLDSTCKLDVPKPLVLDLHQIRARKNSHNRRFLSMSSIIAISAAVAILIGVIVVSLMNSFVRKKIAERVWSASSRSASSLTIGKLILFDTQIPSLDNIPNPESLLDSATRINKNVYKLALASPIGEVAMKKLNPQSLSTDVIEREIRALAKLKHPNLNSLKGYYMSPSLQLVISQYVPNGSMESKVVDSSIPWNVRAKVIVGAAKGLTYLHDQNVIHCGFKPSNVLVDTAFNPMISDYGLGRVVEVRNGGYTAPELAKDCANVSEKCDVYGFGVFAVEMVTGRRNVAVERVREKVERGDGRECVDCTMGEECEMLYVLRVGLLCASLVPSYRPTMPQVLHMLHAIPRHLLLP